MPGTGRIFLDNVICSSNDSVLAQCGHYGVGTTINCDHSKDVAIKCSGKHKCMYVTLRFNYIVLFYGDTTISLAIFPTVSSGVNPTLSVAPQSMMTSTYVMLNDIMYICLGYIF